MRRNKIAVNQIIPLEAGISSGVSGKLQTHFFKIIFNILFLKDVENVSLCENNVTVSIF